MDKYINTGIYFTYLVIASVSVAISYQVSFVMSLIVLAIESVRIIAIYKKVYAVIILVFILNTFLIGYNGYKAQNLIEHNNAEIVDSNNRTKAYIEEKRAILSANKHKDLIEDIKELKEISVDWWLLVSVYLFLEISLILLIMGINRQEKHSVKPKVIKKEKLNGKNIKNNTQGKEKKSLETAEIKQEISIDNEKGRFIGSARYYAKDNGLSVREAEKELKDLKDKGLLIKKDGKNYLISEVENETKINSKNSRN